MSEKRVIEIFSAGCEVCTDQISQIRKAACASCDVYVLDMQDSKVAKKAKQFGITSLPAVIVDGKLIPCNGSDLSSLKAAGLGRPIKAEEKRP